MALDSDQYLTIQNKSEGIFKDKGSKFYSFAFPVNSEEEIKKIQKQLRKKYYDARHHCYAFRLGADNNIYRASDDGEPANSSGPPILGQIQSKELTNILVVVVRYFGGTKLGIPGLIHAYRTATIDALDNAKIITKTVEEIFNISFKYEKMNDIMRIIKDEKLIQFDQAFELDCQIKVKVRKNDSQRIVEKFSILNQVEIEYVKTI